VSQPRPERVFSLREVTRLLKLGPRRIAQLRRLGVLHPGESGYGFREVVAVRVASELLEGGVSVRTVRQALEGARRLLPESESPLAEIRLLVEGGRVVATQDRTRFDPRTGQSLLDLDLGGLAREASESLTWGRVRPLVPPADEAEKWFARATEWDGDPERWEQAVEAYERVVDIDPGCAAGWNNLGLLQHRMGRYQRAGDCYRAALAADDRCPQAAFNLGALHEDLGDFATAIGWYRRALEVEPDYADAHFNLAGVLGKAGQAREAAAHWRRYLALDGESSWAEIARSHLTESEPGREESGPEGPR
jgi:tetratricopeptide (TPR) repeat protein